MNDFTILLAPLNLLLLFLGGVVHILLALKSESKREGITVTLGMYHARYPYQIASSLVLSITCYLLMDFAGQLNAAMAFMCGYAGDNLMKKFTDSTEIGKRKNVA